MKKFYLVFLIIFISSCTSKKEKFNKDFFEMLDEIKYVDTKYLISNDSSVIYSQNAGHKFSLYEYSNKQNSIIRDNINYDLFNPFYFNHEIHALYDSLGNETFLTT